MMRDNYIYAMVTGAGKGLGKAIAQQLALKGNDLLLLAREGEGLCDFAHHLSCKFKVKVQFFEVDFLQPDVLSLIDKWLKDKEVNMLVNNAGVGGTRFFQQSNLKYIDTILQVNVRMVAMITHMLIPKLRKHMKSYILNVSSMASCCPIAYKTVYPASKAFVYFLSKSLALELKPYGIHVCVLLPGPIKTNTEVIHRIEKQGWWVKAGLQSPEKISSIAIEGMLRGQQVIIPGLVSKLNWFMLKIFPKFLSIPTISKAVKNEIYAQETFVQV